LFIVIACYRSGNRLYCNYSAGDYEVSSPRTIHGLAVPNFTLIRAYFGGFPPKNAKNCQNL